MTAARLSLLGLAVASCIWFALGIRSVHDENAVSALLAAHVNLTVSQARSADAQLAKAGTLNPDEALNLVHAEVLFHAGQRRRALALAKGVVAREPQNAEAWIEVEVMSFQSDPALNRRAQATVQELVPPRPAG